MNSDDARQSLNRDEEMKPGRPPRPATEPAGSRGSSETDKTRTDPATGEFRNPSPEPSGSDSNTRS